MAFVSDFNEEELQRALAAQGGASALSEGPGAVSGGPAAPVGRQAPAAAPNPASPAPGQGTGFVNLSRYFDANAEGAANSAAAMVEPLKLDAAEMTTIGDAAANAVQRGTDPNQIVPGPNDIVAVTGPVAPPNASIAATNAASQSAYDKAHEADYRAAQDNARGAAVRGAQDNALGTARGYLEDPNKLAADMSKGGTTPSQFDTYLTGAAMPNAYAGLTSYYGGGAGAPPRPAPPSQAAGPIPAWDTPRGQRPPPDAASALDPDLRRKSKSKGGW